MSKSFLIIGLGRFGSSIVKELHKTKSEIVVCEQNERLISDLDEHFHHHVLGDARENSVLDDLDVNNYDVVIVAIGEAYAASILIVKKLKDRGCKYLIAKAPDRDTGEILEALGADEVIYPEEEAGARVARKMSFNGLLEYIELSESVSGIEIEVPSEFYGKSLSELNFTEKYGLTVALILRNKEPLLDYFAYEAFEPGDNIFVIGDIKKLDKFNKKFCD